MTGFPEDVVNRSPLRGLQQQQVPGAGANNGTQGYPVVERHQTAQVGHRQRQQIYIGDLVVPEHPCPVDQTFGAQRNAVRPERVVEIAANLAQFVAHRLEADRTKPAVSRQIQYPYDAVFD